MRRSASSAQASSASPAPRGSIATLPLLRPAPVHWATAVARNGQVRLEARVGRKTVLVNLASNFRLDLTAHQINSVSFAPDSSQFATGHEDALVRIWDSQTGGLVRSLKGAEAPILTVHFSPEGRRVAAGTSAGHVVVWDINSGEEIARLATFSQPASCLRWSRRGDRIAVTLGGWAQSDVATLLLWSPAEKALLMHQPLEQPAGALQWLAEDEALLIAAWNGQALVWNIAGAGPVAELQLEKNQVSAAAWSPDCPLVNNWLASQLFMRTP